LRKSSAYEVSQSTGGRETSGNLAAAFKDYQASLAIQDRLAQLDPGNAGWQHDLSVIFDRVGDLLVAQGNLAEALNPTAIA
jgi:Flp pilus assembly protein TadD